MKDKLAKIISEMEAEAEQLNISKLGSPVSSMAEDYASGCQAEILEKYIAKLKGIVK